ncbi:hypothetical protein [Actinomadura terrae]|uniref:hypothetical protein n=1 Tax=Actinomadura terrae TaxID=604353 RepID=UPI001FA7514F|nr:hypothetical protein [Actinomadura terrae]
MLAVVHNVTSLTRLLDVVSALDSDPRLQVLFTWTRSSPFVHDVEEFLNDIGALTIPWDQALSTEFDLAITASYGGDLHQIKAPIIAVSHGMGYNKKLSRNSEDSQAAFGFSAEWLLHEGRVVPASIVLSHPEQAARLARDCPEAVPAAIVAGDPCLDRITASTRDRERYRRAFGVPPHKKHIVVSSTWGPRSLMAENPELLPRLLSELPIDEYQVTAALHPNIWHGHGPWQVASWLAECGRAGLNVLPPRDGWRAALVAADVVIGDHGSVTFYGAVLGHPVLLAAFPDRDLDSSSPVARLGRLAPRLSTRRPLAPQIAQALAEHDPARYADVTGCATSVLGDSSRLLRTELYRLMRLDEPRTPPVVLRVPPPTPQDLPSGAVTAALVSVEWNGEEAVLKRYPAATAMYRENGTDGRHLAVDDSEAEGRLLNLADVVYCLNDGLTTTANDWLSETLQFFPGCHVAAAEQRTGECVVRTRGGDGVTCRTDRPDLVASVVYGWLASGRSMAALPAECTVSAGLTSHRFHFGHH